MAYFINIDGITVVFITFYIYSNTFQIIILINNITILPTKM
jgi:hypothetical protein